MKANLKKISNNDLKILKDLEKKTSWLSAWMVHNANNIRSSRDGLKVGGHQASSASIISIMAALYFEVLNKEDRVAVKPHASPVFHAIQYIFGNQSKKNLENFRAFGGAQSYPSRTKDTDDVDYSTGSVGLGGAITIFGSLIQDYLIDHKFVGSDFKPGKMIALLGDAELDEGNIYEALLEGAKQNVRNCWWIIDYNRQSLDAVVADKLHLKIDELFASMGWRVITLKYGKKLQNLAKQKGGNLILNWIDSCPNDLYSALSFLGGAAWREHLLKDLGKNKDVLNILHKLDDNELGETMSNLAGNDIEAVLEGFAEADDDLPTCFIAYTIKGFGLPLAGHKDNHAGLMNNKQIEEYQKSLSIKKGTEWEISSGLKSSIQEINKYLSKSSFYNGDKRIYKGDKIDINKKINYKISEKANTQEAFGRLLNEIGKEKSELSDRIVTFSPDVTVSTNLGGWVNQRQIYNRESKTDIFHDENVLSAQKWSMSPGGQHFELGIAENNLFLTLAAAGLSSSIFGSRLIPIGTIYDTFISRGLDALNYALYQDARFLLVATPSGISLGPEGGAHQSIITPLIGIGQPNLLMFEPTYADELEIILRYSFSYMQKENGSSVYIRLTTRSLLQPKRNVDIALENQILSGGYWLKKSETKSDFTIVFSGALAPEVEKAAEILQEDIPNISILMITSSDRLYKNWRFVQKERSKGKEIISRIEEIFYETISDSLIVSVIDGHSSSLSWIGGAVNRKIISLGVDEFGQSGNLIDLYKEYGIDSDAIIDACAQALLI
tara:strand:- start:1340 stop:3682 length:2343 start_codon:yes stop_codon:yes gene_type:complete